MCCSDKSLRQFGRIFVVFVILLITIVPFLTHFYLLEPWFEYHQDRSFILYAGPYYLGVLSIWVNYYYACKTIPGYVPKKYKPNPKLGKPRFCSYCQNFKPPRAHHCSICKKCVLKMDHHCPYLNTCVGFKNHGFFLRFLASVSFSCTYALLLLGLRILDFYNYQQDLSKYYAGNSGWKIRYTPPMTLNQVVVFIVVVLIMFILLLIIIMPNNYRILKI